MNTLTPEMTGLLGAVIGSVIGFAGGLLGTWMAFGNVPGSVQSRFLKKAAVFCWIGALAFTATTLLVPGTWKWLLWSVYGPLLATAPTHTMDICFCSQRSSELPETCGISSEPQPLPVPRA